MTKRVGWMAKIGGLGRSMAMALVAVVVLLISATPARAQMGAEFAQLFDPPVNSREVEQMVQTLGLDETHKKLAEDLHETMSAEFVRLSGIVREMLKQVQEEAQDEGRAGVWNEVGKKLEQFQEKKKSMQEQYFSDVKLVLNEEQLAKWDSFERRWYRGRQMGNAQMRFISAMQADVVLLVEELKLNPEQMALVAPVLDQYEREVDRELRAFEKLTEEQQEEWGKIRESGDWLGNMDKMNALFAELRDSLVGVRDLNVKYHDQVASRLEGEPKTKFTSAYEKAAFPSLYKDTYVDSGVRTVLEMPDLTGEQRSEVTALHERYVAEVAALNKKLEKAMMDADTQLQVQELWGSGGKGGPKAELEAEKKKLLNERYAQLRGLLTEEQVAKLPEPEGSDWRNTDFEF